LYSSSLKPTITSSDASIIGLFKSIGSFSSQSIFSDSSRFSSFKPRLLYFVPLELKTKSIPAFSTQDLIEVEVGVSFLVSQNSTSILFSLKKLKAFLTELQVFIP
jgi:hypothetical protein